MLLKCSTFPIVELQPQYVIERHMLSIQVLIKVYEMVIRINTRGSDFCGTHCGDGVIYAFHGILPRKITHCIVIVVFSVAIVMFTHSSFLESII